MKHLLVAVGVVVALAACSTATSPASSASAVPIGGTTVTSADGPVTVSATWAGGSKPLVFDVKLDTHSVDLDAVDLSSAVLRNDRGQALDATSWQAASGGHHRQGSLGFGADGAAFIAGSKWIELVIRDVGGVPERTLRWTVGA